MPTHRVLRAVATLNVAVAFTHQADAAYWREWEMFGLPGGVQLFNLCNLLLFCVLLVLLGRVLRDPASASGSSFAICAASGAILPIHAGFALAGFPQFDLPVSIALIVASFVLSCAQVALTLRNRARATGS